MPKLSGRVPKYRLHKTWGQAVVTIDGRDHYLGTYGEPASRARYDRLIAEWLAAERRQPLPSDTSASSATVNGIIASYWDHARSYYRKADGTSTSEMETLRQALRPLIESYGDLPATSFGPRALKTVRQKMIALGWPRPTWSASHPY
jgi:hypothetical protein